MSLVIFSIIFYATLTDLRDCKIPNLAVVAITIIGLFQSILTSYDIGSFNSPLLMNSLSGFFIGLVICIVLYMAGIFGAGDAKLLASLGITVGYPKILILIAMAIFISGLLSCARLSCYGELSPMLSRWYQSVRLGCYIKPEANTVASSAVPMGGAILLATVFCEFYLF